MSLNDALTPNDAAPVAPETAAPAAPAVEAAAPVAPAAPVRPEGLPDAFWDETAGVKPEAYSRLAELEAAAVAAAEGVPETVDGYTFALPADLKDAAGNAVAIDKNDPLAKAAASWAKENGVSDAKLNGLLKGYAEAQIAAGAEIVQAQAAEVAKLGPKAKERIAAYTAAAKHHLGDKADALLDGIETAAQAEAFEALIGKLGATAITTPEATATDEFEGLSGSARLAAIRAKQAG